MEECMGEGGDVRDSGEIHAEHRQFAVESQEETIEWISRVKVVINPFRDLGGINKYTTMKRQCCRGFPHARQ